jgi:Phage terminase large subunit (GpA)
MWEHIAWSHGAPHDAHAICPAGCIIDEASKPAMVEAGEWRITAPEVQGHAGFRLNVLVSLFKNSSWSKLAARFEKAKNNSALLRVFENTALAARRT